MRYILLIVLLLIGLTVYFVLQPEPIYEVGKKTATPAEETEAAEAPAEAPEAATDNAAAQRLAEMQRLYERLEKSRRNLDRRLSRLKALLWDIELPQEEASQIKQEMFNAYGLLKNKKLLGAFNGLEELRQEISRVESAHANLEPILVMAREKEKADRPAVN